MSKSSSKHDIEVWEEEKKNQREKIFTNKSFNVFKFIERQRLRELKLLSELQNV